MKKLIYITIMLFVASSCDVFDQDPQSDITQDIIFSNEEGVNAAVLGMYSTLQLDGLYGVNIPFGMDQYGDVLRFGGFFEEFNQLDSKFVPTPNAIVLETWAAAYRAINLANIIIASAPNVNDDGYSEAERNEHIAIAKAVRALCHFDLLRHYGEWWDSNSEYGVPVITESTGGDLANVLNVARSTVAQTWSQIELDLSEASGNVPDAGSKIFITQGFIDGMMARYYLYTGDYDNAISTATGIIDNGGYTLMDYYPDAFSPSENSEDIFKLVFNVQDQSSLATFTISREEVLPETELTNRLTDDPDDERNDLIGTVAGSNVIRILKYPDGANNTDPAMVLRLAEIYLIRAEAYILRNSAGDLDLAIADINTLRQRAGAADAAYTNVSDLTQTYLDETTREMFGESYRWFALIRTEEWANVIGIADFRKIYPIPFQEMNIDGTLLVQNPGYDQ